MLLKSCDCCHDSQCNIHCSCSNISFRTQVITKCKNNSTSDQKIASYPMQKPKYNHIHNLNYRSINISDSSIVLVKQSSPSHFHITCLECYDSFIVHTYEDHALMKASNYYSKSFADENQNNFQHEDKKTMNYFFPLELRRFCSFDNSNYDMYYDQSSDISYDNENNNVKNIEKDILQDQPTVPLFEKKYGSNENDFDDSFGPVFFQDSEPIVGPYTSSPVLNWNVSDAY
ncbi:hypothetical protein M9Y10_014183 [Tritrichomonas musculus]|uniref:C2H2-type domain-containing protein n=1 Tax=Tritrichomonas musculus TaxID=1915356 RepID=A0ABR2KZR3_9EUKA